MSQDTLDLIEQKRRERKDALAGQRREQKARDLAALDELEVEFGDECVEAIEVPFSPGLPTIVVARMPTRPEIKRYQARVKPAAQNREIDAPAASEELGRSCMVYPRDAAARDALVEARPGVLTMCGNAALRMAQGKAASEGKD